MNGETRVYFIDPICQLRVDDKRSRKALEKGQCTSTTTAVHVVEEEHWPVLGCPQFLHMLCFARLVLACI